MNEVRIIRINDMLYVVNGKEVTVGPNHLVHDGELTVAEYAALDKHLKVQKGKLIQTSIYN
jgi:hypothetical protein